LFRLSIAHEAEATTSTTVSVLDDSLVTLVVGSQSGEIHMNSSTYSFLDDTKLLKPLAQGHVISVPGEASEIMLKYVLRCGGFSADVPDEELGHDEGWIWVEGKLGGW